MINAIPFYGWFLSLIFHTSLAVPFWFIWTQLQIGEKFFDFLPAKYTHIGFWNTVGVFIVVSIIKAVFLPHFSVSNKQKVTSR